MYIGSYGINYASVRGTPPPRRLLPKSLLFPRSSLTRSVQVARHPSLRSSPVHFSRAQGGDDISGHALPRASLTIAHGHSDHPIDSWSRSPSGSLPLRLGSFVARACWILQDLGLKRAVLAVRNTDRPG
jgi:hypothetical protein